MAKLLWKRMNRFVYMGLIGVILASIILVAFLIPATLPQSGSESIEICVHSLSLQDAQLVSASGAYWIRIDCSDNLSNFNESVRNAKAYNLSVLAILDSWMFNQNCTFTLEEWRGNVTHYVTQYANYVDAWEIWNEPTSTTPGWQLQVDYLSMVQIASQIIRQNDPTAKIILFGGLQLYTGGSETAYSLAEDREFARNLSSLNFMQYGDAISVHAYPWGGQVNKSVWTAYSASLVEYRTIFDNSSLDIWVTETGQNITDSGEEGQAQYLKDALSFFNGNASHVFWYALHDENTSKGDFGLIRNGTTPRQAYTQMQESLNP